MCWPLRLLNEHVFLFTVVGCGLICLAMAYFVSELGAILQVSSISVVSALIKGSQCHPFVLFLIKCKKNFKSFYFTSLYLFWFIFTARLRFVWHSWRTAVGAIYFWHAVPLGKQMGTEVFLWISFFFFITKGMWKEFNECEVKTYKKYHRIRTIYIKSVLHVFV